MRRSVGAGIVSRPRGSDGSRVRWLWVAAVLAGLGAWMQETATPWLMTGLTGDARLIAGVQAAITLSLCLAVLPAATLVDLVDVRRLLRGAHAALALMALALAFLVLFDMVGPPLLLLLAGMMGLGHGILAAGWPVLAAGAAGGSGGGMTLGAAHAGQHWTGRATGGSLGGLVIATAGVAAALCVDAGALLAATLSLRRIPATRVAAPVTTARFRVALRDGVQTAALTPTVRNVLVRGAATAFGASATWSLLVVVARGRLDLGPAGFGLLQGAVGLGGAAGVVVIMRLRRRWPGGSVATVLGAVCGVSMVMLAISTAVASAAICLFFTGASWIGLVVVLVTAAEVAVPDVLRGRMLGVCLAVLYLATALGSVVWGHVAEAASPRTALLIAAGTVLLGAAGTAKLSIGRLLRR